MGISKNIIRTPSGNAGIGTTSPEAVLDVRSDGTGKKALLVSSNTTYSGDVGPELHFKIIQSNGQAATAGMIRGYSEGSWAGGLLFHTHVAGSPNDTTSERLRINKDGNVGIGTTNPLQKLVADAAFGQPATSGATQNGVIRLQVDQGAGWGEVLDMGMHVGVSGPASYGWLQATNKGNHGINYNLVLNANGGNVGIGTTTVSYKLDVSGTTRAYATLTGVAGVVGTDNIIGSLSGLVGWYVADSYNATAKVWYDISGNGNHTNDSRGSPITATFSGGTKNSSKTFKVVQGGTSDGLVFPSGILPSTYTLFHVTRYNGTQNRIIQGTDKNWLSGHWSGNAGVAYHEGWLTPQTDTFDDGWLISSDQKGLYRGQAAGTLVINDSAGGNTNARLSVNAGYSSEYSDWQCAEIIVFNRELSATEIRYVEKYLGEKYGIQCSNVYIDGKVGIGTTIPATTLHIGNSSKLLVVGSGTPTGTYNGVINAHVDTGTVGMQVTVGSAYSYFFADANDILLGSSIGTTGQKVKISRSSPDSSLILDSNGNIGINATSPQAKLDVRGISLFGDYGSYGAYNSNAAVHVRKTKPHIIVEAISYNTSAIAANGTTYGLVFAVENGGMEWRTGCTYNGDFTATGTSRMSLSSTGTLTVSGDVVAYGSPSDITLKTNIKSIIHALTTVTQLRGVTFDWKEDTDVAMTNIKEDIGFIAQEVQAVLPTIVRENENGKLSLRDKAIIPLLVEAIKELKADNDDLRSLITDLRNKS